MEETTPMGTQKAARFQRLRTEIIQYVEDHPGCTANDIVAHLSIERKMKNHGLTPRKVGYFIPRHCKEIGFLNDSTSGKRVYQVADEENEEQVVEVVA